MGIQGNHFATASPKGEARLSGMPLNSCALVFLAVFLVLFQPAGALASKFIDENYKTDPLVEVEPFDEKKEEELQEAIKAREDARTRFLTGNLSAEQQTAVSQQLLHFMLKVEELERHKRAWESQKAGSVSRDNLDRCINLISRAQALKRREGTENPPSPREWEDLAFHLTPFATGATVAFPDTAPYGTQARLQVGLCYAYMAAARHRWRFDRAKVMEPYIKGIRILDELARTAGRPDPEVEAKLPAEHLTLLAADASVEAANELLRFCPWGVPMFMMMYDMGYTDGFKFEILEPFGATEKLSEGPITSNIPANIEQQMAAVKSGRFTYLGFPLRIRWAAEPKVHYSAWFYAPAAYDMPNSEYAKWGLRAVGAYVSLGGLLVAEATSYLLGKVGQLTGPDNAIYGGSSLVLDAKSMGILDKDFIVKHNLGETSFKSLQTVALKTLEYFESKEVEYLFENINPRNQDVHKQIGNPVSFDGSSHFPQVMIRADIGAFEKVPDYNYPKKWRLVFYYQLDPAAALKLSGKYDLSSKDDRQKHYDDAGDDLGASEPKCWKMLPNKLPLILGSRLYRTSFAPKGQIIKVKASPRQIEKWGKELTAGELSAGLVGPSGSRGEIAAYGEERLTAAEMVFKIANGDHWGDDFIRAVSTLGAGTEIVPEEMIYNEYRLRIYARRVASRTKEGQPNYEYGSQIEEFEVLMNKKPGRIFKGKRASAGRGVLEVTMHLDEPFEVEPKGSNDPLLPPAIRLGLSLDKDGKTGMGYDADDGILPFSANLAPVEADLHCLTVTVDGKRKFYLWDRTERMSSAALFSGNIPFYGGTNKVVVSAKGAKPVECEVERKLDPYTREDFLESKKSVDEYYQDMQDAKHSGNVGGYHQQRFYVVSRYTSLAWEVFEAGQPDAARPFIDNALKMIPTRGELAGGEYAHMVENIDSCTRYANRVLADIAFFQGDAATLLKAGKASLAAKVKDYEKDGPLESWQCHSLADSYGELIERYITCGGGGGGVSELVGIYAQLRQKGGFYNADWDKFKFVYGEGGG